MTKEVRRFPPPWSIIEHEESFAVIDATGFNLAYLYFAEGQRGFHMARLTGIALGWIGATTSFGSVVRNPNRSLLVSPSFTFRTEVQLVQIPANTASSPPSLFELRRTSRLPTHRAPC
jgi:hypothetical protein